MQTCVCDRARRSKSQRNVTPLRLQRSYGLFVLSMQLSIGKQSELCVLHICIPYRGLFSQTHQRHCLETNKFMTFNYFSQALIHGQVMHVSQHFIFKSGPCLAICANPHEDNLSELCLQTSNLEYYLLLLVYYSESNHRVREERDGEPLHVQMSTYLSESFTCNCSDTISLYCNNVRNVCDVACAWY